MKSKRVLDVGNCRPDHAAISKMLADKFSAEVVQAHSQNEAIQLLRQDQFDLVLINRKLDQDYSDGIEIVRALKQDEDLCDVPVMLVTNYSEHQDAAVEAGALRGFGKLELESTETFDRLSSLLLGS